MSFFCCRKEREAAAADVLQLLPNILTSKADSTTIMNDLNIKLKVLLQPENLEPVKSNKPLWLTYNTVLCECLMIAAVNGRREAMPELAGVLRYAADLLVILLLSLCAYCLLSARLSRRP